MKLKANEIDLIKNKSIQKCAQQYIDRQDRKEHPSGQFDNGGRWYPDESEELHTGWYRSPSRAFPYSYMQACRSLEHVAMLNGFISHDEVLAIKRVVRTFKSDLTIENFIENNS